MPQGLQVWDADGNISIDLTDRLTKVLGIFNTGTTVGSKNVVVVPNTEFWYTCIPNANQSNAQYTKILGPNITYSNGVISWNWKNMEKDPNNSALIFPAIIIYGVF